MAVKYKAYYRQMVDAHPQEFTAFKAAHDAFVADRKKGRKQFDALGIPLVEVIREWEQRLCSGMERGKYAKYSADLAEKFWEEVKKDYPFIDLVGVESSLG